MGFRQRFCTCIYSFDPVSACASGAEAIGYALEMIRSGRADIVIAGGVDASVHELPMAGFAARLPDSFLCVLAQK